MHTSGPAPTAAPDPDDVDVTGSVTSASTCMASRTPQDGTHADAADLPILDGVPLLGSAIALAREIDRLVAQLLEVLIELEDNEVAEATTGVMLEQWLAVAGRRTGSDRRMLLTACGALRRLPSLRAAFCDEASVSWAQVRAVVLAVHRLPRALDETIDGELSRTIDACRDADPDMLTSAVSRAARSWDPVPTQKAQEAADRDEFIAMQPRLDGSGGQLFGELGPLSFATVDAALTAPARPTGARVGQHRARRLVELCDAGLEGAGDGRGPLSADAPATDGTGRASRPQLLVRVELSALLDRSSMPAELLTCLTGGKLWLDASTARRLVDARGADLRSIVLDECGEVVGVGRSSRLAPGWLADATLALHDTCTRADCRTPARRCQTDHAVPWHPVRPADLPGRTDIDQLAPLCQHHNRTKEVSGWRVSQSADGTRRWTHPRSGLTTVTRPATWRPVGRDPDDCECAGAGPGSGQGGWPRDRPPGDRYRPARDGPARSAREHRAGYATARERPATVRRSRRQVVASQHQVVASQREMAGSQRRAPPAAQLRRPIHSLSTGGSEGSPDPGCRAQPGAVDAPVGRLEAAQR